MRPTNACGPTFLACGFGAAKWQGGNPNGPWVRSRRRDSFLRRRATGRRGPGEVTHHLADLRGPPGNGAVLVHSREQGRPGLVRTIARDVRRDEESGSGLRVNPD